MLTPTHCLLAAVFFLFCLTGCPDEPCTQTAYPGFALGTMAGSLDVTPTTGSVFHEDVSNDNGGATIDGPPDKPELLVPWFIGNDDYQLRFALGDLRSLKVNDVVRVDTEVNYGGPNKNCSATEKASAILTVTKIQGSAEEEPNWVSDDFIFEGKITFETSGENAIANRQTFRNEEGDCTVADFTDITFSSSISQTAKDYGEFPGCSGN